MIDARLIASDDLSPAPGRVIRLDERTARALAVGIGGVVELMNPQGAPLRAWVVGLLPGDGRRGQIAPTALPMLALAHVDDVEVRAVHSGVLP